MDIQTIQQIMMDNEQMTREMLIALGSALELKKQIQQNERKINDELFSNIPAKYKFTQLEKIIYYFNRNKGVSLKVIGSLLGYNHDYIKQISANINQKINKSTRKWKFSLSSHWQIVIFVIGLSYDFYFIFFKGDYYGSTNNGIRIVYA